MWDLRRKRCSLELRRKKVQPHVCRAAAKALLQLHTPHMWDLRRKADTLGGILGVDIGSLEGRVHECITLSAVMGGLGVHEIKQTAPFSFVASRLQVWPAVLRRLEAHG
jgi:hypothetical protein